MEYFAIVVVGSLAGAETLPATFGFSYLIIPITAIVGVALGLQELMEGPESEGGF